LQYQDDYLQLWEDFLQDALEHLCSDHDYELHDAMAVLRRDCNVGSV